MKKVFLDTNIIMEYLAHRKEFKDLESPLCQVASPHEFVEKFMSADE